jgi:hypothetical protein
LTGSHAMLIHSVSEWDCNTNNCNKNLQTLFLVNHNLWRKTILTPKWQLFLSFIIQRTLFLSDKSVLNKVKHNIFYTYSFADLKRLSTIFFPLSFFFGGPNTCCPLQKKTQRACPSLVFCSQHNYCSLFLSFHNIYIANLFSLYELTNFYTRHNPFIGPWSDYELDWGTKLIVTSHFLLWRYMLTYSKQNWLWRHVSYYDVRLT